MTQPPPRAIGRASASRRDRLRLLVGALVVMLAYFFGDSLAIGTRDGTTPDAGPDPGSPTRESVLSFLRSQALTPTHLTNDTGQPQPFGSEPGTIDSPEVDRLDGLFTAARFTYTTAQGSFAIEAIINHAPCDGTYAFHRLRISKVVRLRQPTRGGDGPRPK